MPPRAALRVPALAVLVALVVLGAAQAAELTGTDRADRLLGTSAAETIRGRGGNDRIEGVSPCHRRLRRLESDGVIRGYRAIVDPAAIGLGFEVLVHVTMDREDAATVAEFEQELCLARPAPGRPFPNAGTGEREVAIRIRGARRGRHTIARYGWIATRDGDLPVHRH